MGLTREQVIQSTERLSSMFAATPQQKAAWAQMLYEVFGSWKPFEFEEVCKAMVLEVASGRKPVPKQFIEVRRKLSQARGWDATYEARVCSGCGNNGFVYAHFLIQESGDEVDAMKPCPVCRPTSTVREGWAEMDQPKVNIRTQFAMLSDEAKAHALEYGDALAKMTRKPEYLEDFIKNVTTGE